MLEVTPITVENFESLTSIYSEFTEVAVTDYGWPSNAIGYSDLRKIFKAKLMNGFFLREFPDNEVVGFMLFQYETYQALEIKVIYLREGTPVKTALDTLMNTFMEAVKSNPDWDVLSYPLLGAKQLQYTDYITWYGFKPVGQAVVKFDIFDGITVEIFKNLDLKPPPEGYQFVTWDPQYEEGVIDVLTESFANSVDALWDPRFRNREGLKEAIAFLQSGGYGLFWPPLNAILLNPENKPVGICFMNVVSQEEANIPLIGLLKSEQNHKLGKSLLAQSVNACLNEVLKGKLGVSKISATVATENFPAVKMYRHVGFQEDHWYPHVYQERHNVISRRASQWC